MLGIFKRKLVETQDLSLEISYAEGKSILSQIYSTVCDYQKRETIGTTKTYSKNNYNSETIPLQGEPIADSLEFLMDKVYANNLNENHQRFFDYIPAAPSPISIFANLLSAGVNPFVGSWLEASGSTELELQVINWIDQLAGYSKDAGGIFLNSGSESNMHALRIARKIVLGDDVQKVGKAVIYVSDQINQSIYKGLKTLGFTSENSLRIIPTNENFELSIVALQQSVQQDKQNGYIPFCVVANLGATATGAIDPLVEISEICVKENIWFHVDAAYGGGFLLSENFRKAFHDIGLHTADSIVINPHKAMFTPYGNSLLLVKNSSWLPRVYGGKDQTSVFTNYNETEVNFYQCGPHWTRNDRQVLELWLSLRYYGLQKLGGAIDKIAELGDFSKDALNSSKKLVCVTKNLSVVTFTIKDSNLSQEEKNNKITEITKKVNATKMFYLGKTELRGNLVFRICILNPKTTHKDILNLFSLIEEMM